MRPAFPVFPGGGAGAALLLLRLSVAGMLIALLLNADPPAWKWFAAILTAIGLCAGFWTRVLSGACAIILILGVTGAPLDVLSLVPSLIDSIVLGVIGPGAFSIDARLFGRRTVLLSSGRNTIR